MKHPIPDAALEQHTAILGKTGSGKSTTAKLLVEQVVASGARVCVLDTIKSDWWGITSSADGKRPGLPFQILGGPRGHVPLPSSAGRAVAEIVANGSLPLSIIDMADFDPGGIQKFFVDFAPVLLRKMRGVVYLVIEEAHEIAPKERAGFGAENMAIHWAKKLATAGRSRGIRLVVATQRTQSLHNAVLGSCETVIVHRLTTPADQNPVLAWLKANSTKDVLLKVEESLSSLKTGTAWLCSGEARIFERVAFPRIKTYDNTATPTGDGSEQHVKMAPVDQDRLRAIIGTAVKEAEANDPKRLKAQIAELNRALSSKAPAAVHAPAVAPDPRALREAEERGKRQGFEEARPIHHAEGVKEGLRMAQLAVARVEAPDPKVATIKPRVAVPVPAAPPPTPRPAPSAPTDTGEVGSGGLRRIMIALAQCPKGLTNRQIGVRAGLSSKSGTFSTYLSRARTNGWITGRGVLEITQEGLAALGSYEPLPSGPALLDHWLRELGDSGAARLLRAVAAAYPASLSNAEAAERASLSSNSGTFSTYLSKLRTLELVEGRGELRASDDLFAEAA